MCENKKKEIDLGNDPISSLLVRLSLPAIFSMVAAAAYNLVDSIFIGWIDPLGLAAVSLTMPIQIVQMAFVLMIGVGAATLISIECGRDHREKAHRILQAALIYFVLTQLAVTLFGILFMHRHLQLLGAHGPLYPYARTYALIILIGGVPGLTGYCLNNCVRSLGHARQAMTYVVTSSLLNIVLDALFVLVLRMGVAGAAVATVLSQTMVTICVLYFFHKHPVAEGTSIFSGSVKDAPDINIQTDDRFSVPRSVSPVSNLLRMFAEISVSGMPSFFMQVFGAVVSLLLNRVLVRFGGDYHLFCYKVIQSLGQFFLMVIYGVGQGVQPIIGFNYGAKKTDRMRRALFLAMRFVICLTLLFVLLLAVFPGLFIRLFTSDAQLITMIRPNIRLCLGMLPFVAIHSITTTYAQSTKQSILATILYILRFGGILLPLLFVLPPLYGIRGVYISAALSDGLSGTAAAILLLICLRNQADIRDSLPRR